MEGRTPWTLRLPGAAFIAAIKSASFGHRSNQNCGLKAGRTMSLIIDGRILQTDGEGYLQQPSAWRVDVATEMARRDGIELSDSHWEVINFLRQYYDEYKIAPAIRILTRAMAKKLGREKGNTRYLYELFPDGPAKQACRYAGLPKPTGCI
jgi:tRNA 2-thiouridine synthesizing protein E